MGLFFRGNCYITINSAEIQLNHYHIMYFKTVRKVDAKHYSMKPRDIQREVLMIVIVVSAVLHMHRS